MIRLLGLWLGCALCVTPVAADEDLFDGPTAIKPLTVTPQPQHSAPPNTVCDFEHQCYPEKGGPAAPAPMAPPAIVVNPIAPRPQVPDEPVVTTWRGCMDPCRPTSSRTTSTPYRWRRGAVRCAWRSRMPRTTPGLNPRFGCRRLRGWANDATSVAAGGPSAATPTATVQRGVVASDDRKRERSTAASCAGRGLYRALNLGPCAETL
jgi:hypothetical protein